MTVRELQKQFVNLLINNLCKKIYKEQAARKFNSGSLFLIMFYSDKRSGSAACASRIKLGIEGVEVSGIQFILYQAEVFADAIVTRLAEENEEAYPYQAIFSQAIQNELETDLSWLDTGVF